MNKVLLIRKMVALFTRGKWHNQNHVVPSHCGNDRVVETVQTKQYSLIEPSSIESIRWGGKTVLGATVHEVKVAILGGAHNFGDDRIDGLWEDPGEEDDRTEQFGALNSEMVP